MGETEGEIRASTPNSMPVAWIICSSSNVIDSYPCRAVSIRFTKSESNHKSRTPGTKIQGL